MLGASAALPGLRWTPSLVASAQVGSLGTQGSGGSHLGQQSPTPISLQGAEQPGENRDLAPGWGLLCVATSR